jgi:hypothetical protein
MRSGGSARRPLFRPAMGGAQCAQRAPRVAKLSSVGRGKGRAPAHNEPQRFA